MGLSLTRTGWMYPFFGTLLGWLGVALTVLASLVGIVVMLYACVVPGPVPG